MKVSGLLRFSARLVVCCKWVFSSGVVVSFVWLLIWFVVVVLVRFVRLRFGFLLVCGEDCLLRGWYWWVLIMIFGLGRFLRFFMLRSGFILVFVIGGNILVG